MNKNHLVLLLAPIFALPIGANKTQQWSDSIIIQKRKECITRKAERLADNMGIPAEKRADFIAIFSQMKEELLQSKDDLRKERKYFLFKRINRKRRIIKLKRKLKEEIRKNKIHDKYKREYLETK